jgi:two-component system response regulator HydG
MAHDANGSRILVIDDEQAHAQVMSDALSRQGHRCELAYGVDEAMAKLKRGRFDVVVTDLMMDGRPAGLELLAAARALVPPPSVVLVTAHADIATCKRAMAEGAYDYIEKPLDLDSFRTQVNRAAERSVLLRDSQVLREQVEDSAGFEGIVGKSAAMQEVVRVARQVAGSDIPVLVMGESGTGKELIARAIHQNSQRRKNLLVALNCAGLSESILEDELFGHVRGAYTGAAGEREGRFEHADGGTLFMDEIGDMPAAMQAKLLRVLENGEVVRLGSNDPIRVNVRLISATNRNLDQMVAEKKFREDLFFRIKGVTIDIPPLRERRDDIPLLIHYFLSQAADRYGKMIDGIEPEARQALLGYSWPGNVRQLKNVMENMVVMTNSKTLLAQSLPTEIRPTADHSISGMNNLVGISITQAEKELIRNTLKMVEGNREEAAKILGIGERTLYRKIREYDL